MGWWSHFLHHTSDCGYFLWFICCSDNVFFCISLRFKLKLSQFSWNIHFLHQKLLDFQAAKSQITLDEIYCNLSTVYLVWLVRINLNELSYCDDCCCSPPWFCTELFLIWKTLDFDQNNIGDFQQGNNLFFWCIWIKIGHILYWAKKNRNILSFMWRLIWVFEDHHQFT